jgi:DNA ligase D-like protein (predicted 3'-phosphoesterase)
MPAKKDQSKITLLKKYKEKRNFSKTPEPIAHPTVPAPSKTLRANSASSKTRELKSKDEQILLDKKKRIFCIQEHHARHLHWDFRLEIDGVMPSWAIPKGPSTDPKVKRLAIQTENHPISYAKFEGIIPEGEYGAGTVMVWDYGTYKNIREKDSKLIPMDKCMKEGRIEIFLEGKKLQGTYVLIRLKDSKKDWLFFKKKDEFADARRNPIKTQNKSVLTDRTITQIKRNENKKNKPYKECS